MGVTTTSTHPLVGELVDGRYRVVRHLADGGMATVLLATDTRLDRDVALKVMRPDLAADETFVSRFRREARAAARLSHPNVVPVFDQGEDSGRVFLAMEYIEGRTAREVVDAEGALAPRTALDLLEAVLTGLTAAHEAGYIHRDVKPENILIADRGPVKVADFGLARAVTSQTTTADDEVLFGTVAYLSPEQVERGIADARSDVYAAGLILFELLTGNRAIKGESPIHVAFQHVHGGVPAPSERVAGLPTPLDDLVTLATHRDPDERPRDAGEYLVALRATRDELSREQLDARPDRSSRPPAGGAATRAHPRPERTRALDPATAAVSATSDGEEPPSSDRRRSRRSRIALLALLVAVLAGVWYVTAGPGAAVVVPDVAGDSSAEAAATLEDHDLEVTEREAFDESVPAGDVISATPGSGSETSKGSEVSLVVSRGPERHDVPALAGETTTAAKKALAKHHLDLGDTSQQWHDSLDEGQVISSDPSPGTALKRDTTVDLVVSKGPEPVDVPSVTGRSLATATSSIEGADLEVARADDAYSTSVPKGSVVSQSPASGSLVPGGTVTLTVSRGPEMVAVPEVEGLTRAGATKKLEDAGFTVAVQTFLGGPIDEVRASRPGGGTSAPKGSKVTILVV